MEEEETKKDASKEEVGKSKDSGEGDKSKTLNLYERTNEATERLEKANAKTEEILNRQEEIYQRQKLGGTTEAGQATEKKEETPREYRARINKEMAAGKTEW